MVLGEVPSLGPVLLFDNIEDLFKWVESGSGGDSVFEKITTVAYNGSACLHMKTRTTNAAADDTVAATRKLYQRPGKRYRIELIFRYEVMANTRGFKVGFSIYDGTNKHDGYVVFNAVTERWYYYNSAGVETELTGFAYTPVQAGWHRFVLDIDVASGKYIQAIVDSREYDMSTLSFKVAAQAGGSTFDVFFELTAEDTTPPEAYYDDVLVMEI